MTGARVELAFFVFVAVVSLWRLSAGAVYRRAIRRAPSGGTPELRPLFEASDYARRLHPWLAPPLLALGTWGLPLLAILAYLDGRAVARRGPPLFAVVDAQACMIDALRADIIRTGGLVVELTRDRTFLRAHLARTLAPPPEGPERFHAWRVDRICCDGPRRQALVVDGKVRHPRSTWCAVCKAQADGPGMTAEWTRCIFEPGEEGQTWDEGTDETKAPPGILAMADEARASAKNEEIARVVTALEAMAVGEWIGWGRDQIERYADGWGPRSTEGDPHVAWCVSAAEIAAHFVNHNSLAFDKITETRDVTEPAPDVP